MRFDFQNREDNRVGHYPVGHMNSWHGGIHIAGEIKAIADGEIIAYKISSKYMEAKKKTEDGQEIVRYYSDGFVLIKHTYQYNIKELQQATGKEEVKNKEFIFYSLYLHLLIKDEMLAKDKYPEFFHCKQKIKSDERLEIKLSHKSGINLRDSKKNILGIIPAGCKVVVYPMIIGDNWYKVKVPKIIKTNKIGECVSMEIVSEQTEGYYYNKKLSSQYEIRMGGTKYGKNYSYRDAVSPLSEIGKSYFYDKTKVEEPENSPSYCEMLYLEINTNEDEIKPISGAILRKDSNAESDVIGIIPTGIEVKIVEKGSDDWFKVKTSDIYILKENTAMKVVYEKQSLKEGYTGWCRNTKGQFDDYIKPEFDKIVKPEKPVKVQAGELIGYSGKYESVEGKILSNYAASHLEVFSNDDVPAFLKDMKTLVTDDNKLYELAVTKNGFKTESYTYINSKEYAKIETKKTIQEENIGKRIPPSKLKLSEEGKAFIKAWEGERLTGYLDTKNILTIGVGVVILERKTGKAIVLKNSKEINSPETIKRVDLTYITKEKGHDVIKITQEKSNDMFNKYVSLFEEAVRKLNIDFYQWEFDAMVSLFYNAGENVKAPSLRRNLANKNYADAGKQFNDITSHDNEGLVYRRAAEMDMFLNGGSEGYVYFKNNDVVRRDELVNKLNDIRKELGVASFKKIIKK